MQRLSLPCADTKKSKGQAAEQANHTQTKPHGNLRAQPKRKCLPCRQAVNTSLGTDRLLLYYLGDACNLRQSWASELLPGSDAAQTAVGISSIAEICITATHWLPNLVFARSPWPVRAVAVAVIAGTAIYQHAERSAMSGSSRRLDDQPDSRFSALGLGHHPHPLFPSSCLATSSAPASLFPPPPYPKAAICRGINRLVCRPTTKDDLCWASLHAHVFQILRTLCRHHAISQAAKPASQAHGGLASNFERNTYYLLGTKVCIYATPRPHPAERVWLHPRGIRGLCLHAGSIFSFTGRACSL